MSDGYNDEGKGMETGIGGLMFTFVLIMIAISIMSIGFNMLIDAQNGGSLKNFCEGFKGHYIKDQSVNYSTCDILNNKGEIYRMKVLCVDSNCQLKSEIVNIKLHSEP